MTSLSLFHSLHIPCTTSHALSGYVRACLTACEQEAVSAAKAHSDTLQQLLDAAADKERESKAKVDDLTAELQAAVTRYVVVYTYAQLRRTPPLRCNPRKMTGMSPTSSTLLTMLLNHEPPPYTTASCPFCLFAAVLCCYAHFSAVRVLPRARVGCCVLPRARVSVSVPTRSRTNS